MPESATNGMLTKVGKLNKSYSTLATAGMPTNEGRPATAGTPETVETQVTKGTSTSVETQTPGTKQ
jgi:hypothetical protein